MDVARTKSNVQAVQQGPYATKYGGGRGSQKLRTRTVNEAATALIMSSAWNSPKALAAMAAIAIMVRRNTNHVKSRYSFLYSPCLV